METVSKTLRYHSENQIIGDKIRVIIRRKFVEEQVLLCLLSKSQPKIVEEACKDQIWMKAIKENLNQIEINQTWELVSRPIDNNVIRTKWVFRSKLDEDGQVERNKSRLVCKGYTQFEEIDFEETYAPVPRMELCFWLLQHIRISKSIKWMWSQYF